MDARTYALTHARTRTHTHTHTHTHTQVNKPDSILPIIFAICTHRQASSLDSTSLNALSPPSNETRGAV